MPRSRLLAIGVAAAIVVAPLLGVSSASAAPGQNILVFVNSNVSDTAPGQEVDQTLAALAADGATVTTFDGGDGSDAAWTAALAGVDDVIGAIRPGQGRG